MKLIIALVVIFNFLGSAKASIAAEPSTQRTVIAYAGHDFDMDVYPNPDWSSLEKEADKDAVEKCSDHRVTRISNYNHLTQLRFGYFFAQVAAQYACADLVSDF